MFRNDDWSSEMQTIMNAIGGELARSTSPRQAPIHNPVAELIDERIAQIVPLDSQRCILHTVYSIPVNEAWQPGGEWEIIPGAPARTE